MDDICEKEDVGLIFSLIDPELEHLAQRREHFTQKGILLNTGSYEVVRGCFDKTYVLDFLKKNHFPAIKTYLSAEAAMTDVEAGKIAYPLFAKPRSGSGSNCIAKIMNAGQLASYCQQNTDYIIQEYMDGQEIGVDIYVDLLTNKVVSIFAKKKLKMRAGETDKSISFKNEKLFRMIQAFAEAYRLAGANDIDVFERNGEFYISEVNPRFGGGYLHAYECGVNFPAMLINNMNGIANAESIGNYKENICMMKYFDVSMMELK